MSKIGSATRQLVENPNLENIKKQARGLLRELHAGRAAALVRARNVHARSTENARFSLSDAQRVIAREYGFQSWPKLKAHVARLAPSTESDLAQTRALVDRLHALLALIARRVEWLSKPELARLRAAGDVSGLIALGSGQCDEATQQAVRELEPHAAVARLCAALEPMLGASGPQPLGVPHDVTKAPHTDEAEACLVVLHAAGHPHLIGRHYLLSEPSTVIGRNAENPVVLHSDSVSRVHARIERTNSEFVFLDQNSRNGSFVLEASERVERRVLADGDRLLIGDAILCFLRAPELPQKRRAALEYIAQHDALTRAYNQKTWLAETERQVLHARGDGRALSALLVGIDELGALRERIGRLAAESLLSSMALCLRQVLGEAAIIGRYASEEFGVILPGVAAPDATALAERLRVAAATQALTLCGQAATTTVSVGVATLYRTTGAEELVEDALAALARARLAGRNAVSGPQEAAA